MDPLESDTSRLSRLYDGLSRWVLWKNRLSGVRRNLELSMHKTVNPPVDDVAFEAANLPPEPRVLDAGCGLGGTVFRWHQKMGGTYDGLSVSPVEVKSGNREARRRGLSSQVRFSCRSYDQPPAGAYDAVVAIESLIHSTDLSRTLDGLSRGLTTGGRLVVVDDVLADGADGEAGSSLSRLKKFWYLSSLPSEGSVRFAMTSSGLKTVDERDLTDAIQWNHSRFLFLREGLLRLMHTAVPVGWLRQVGKAYRGGLALQRLYDQGIVRYKMFVGEKS